MADLLYRGSPIARALDETGLPWEVEAGNGHAKLRLCGHLVGVIKYGKRNHDKRAELNVIAQIRHKAAELKAREQR
jgi:hypothetical protein